MIGFILFALVAFGGFLAFAGIKGKKVVLTILGIILVAGTLGFFFSLEFLGELFWFQSLGYDGRFWTSFSAQIYVSLLSLLFFFIFCFLILLLIPGLNKKIALLLAVLGGIFSALSLGGSWEMVLLFINQVSSGLQDPILGYDTSFYLFTLPLVDQIFTLLLTLSVFYLVVAILTHHLPSGVLFQNKEKGLFSRIIKQNNFSVLNGFTGEFNYSEFGILVSASLFLFVIGLGFFLDPFHQMFDSTGVVTGPGWTAANVRIPGALVSAMTSWAFIVFLLLPPLRQQITKLAHKLKLKLLNPSEAALGFFLVLIFITQLTALELMPAFFQNIHVTPNQIAMERPYIRHNIDFTRFGFKIHEVTESTFDPSGNLTSSLLEEKKQVIENIRIWDWRALKDVLGQFQAIRPYYEFSDIDLDRYQIEGKTSAVMLAPREMVAENLPSDSQTFVNKHFKYTHGYGIVMTTVNEFTPSGLPNFLIQDLPPQSVTQDLEISRPEIYYGERTNHYVIVNTKEPQFDYPMTDTNASVNYEGDGGILFDSFLKRIVYSYLFGGNNLFFSTIPHEKSRLKIRRNIRQRVSYLAPFLELDRDPYISLIDGELYWIMDAYTASNSFPYSQGYIGSIFNHSASYSIRQNSVGIRRGINYLRNSVKVLINAYDGNTRFYIYDDEDPIIKTWALIYPDLFLPKEAMPPEFRAHLRYPEDFLTVQGDVYSKYHMKDPEVFYNQEDLWEKATEKYYGTTRQVDPYYIVWQRPGSSKAEFVLIQPFTPKGRQVLVGWIAGNSDPENYGEFIAYRFPRDRQILGPQQMETKIDQDRELSQLLSLWDQGGSKVIRGNVLTIPLGNTLLYVEPIYLQSNTAAYPELRLVAVMHGETLSYGESFEGALSSLLQGTKNLILPNEDENISLLELEGVQGIQSQRELIRRASDSFDRYFELMGKQDFQEAAKEAQNLKQALEDLENAL